MRNQAEKSNVPLEKIIQEVNSSPILAAALFAKSPLKQSAHQKLASNFLRKELVRLGCVNFELLPNSGRGAKYVSSGIVLDGVEKNGNKSIDFEWHYSDSAVAINFYASHKYTKEEGGAQDNQFEDLKSFVLSTKGYKKCAEINVFMAIADGLYYQKKVGQKDGVLGRKKTRLDKPL